MPVLELTLVGLELIDPLASASRLLGSKAGATTAWLLLILSLNVDGKAYKEGLGFLEPNLNSQSYHGTELIILNLKTSG